MSYILVQFNSVQSLSRVWLFATPWTAARQASLSITNSRSSLKHVYRVSDAIQPSHPLSSLSPLAFNFSHHQDVFKWVSSLHLVAKVLQFQLQYQSFQVILILLIRKQGQRDSVTCPYFMTNCGGAKLQYRFFCFHISFFSFFNIYLFGCTRS